MKAPTTLIIMDGFALGEDIPGYAVHAAHTPQLDYLFSQYAFCQLDASGLDVGLPQGQMGNSEVGHTNIGAGRVVMQDLPRINRAIEDGSFHENPAFLAAMDACRAQQGALHLMGLLSDGGVHSHIDHLFALIELARQRGLEQLYIHAFLDGRDVAPSSGAGFVRQLQARLDVLGVGKIAHVMGRYYAMDRDSRWDRLQRAYDALVTGDAPHQADPVAAVEASYEKGITDEFMEPVVCCPEGCIQENDSVIFFNFRPDRARELTRALTDPNFDKLKDRRFFPLHFVCTTQYDATIPNVTVAFPHQSLDNCFGAYLSSLGMRQLRIAETEKYAHVTFFFNGGREEPFPGEDRVLIPSPKVSTYDQKPEMSAGEITKEAVRRIRSGQYDVVILNFANCDMVGHTGVYDAAVRAVETVDACVAQVVNATTQMGGVALITADHGNAERMLDEDGAPFTAHTTSPVPFCIVGTGVHLRDGRLADIAPTMLDLMGLNQPEEMDGSTLILINQ